MKKLLFSLSGMLMAFAIQVKADEGMWLPMLINNNMATMTQMGCRLTADDIYNINNSSIKDAIVALDHGSCTAELVSAEGLLLTNHHCGYDEIQSHSSVEHDYLTNGFWAMSKDQELPNPGKKASFLVSVTDVTNQILQAVPAGADVIKRMQIIDSVATEISDKAKKDTHYDAVVEGMFDGNYYYLFIYETFADIRLVGAPPESIGKYGADTDNWMWPRHTGDFSMFRIYTGPDGKPAEYSENNIPYKSKHFLPISLNGYQNNDFTFIMGYPGSTQRYMTSFELIETLEISNPVRIKVRGLKQSIWESDMDKSDKVRIQYSSKFARSSNYWKYSIGQNKGLKRLNVLDKKQKLEADFTNWVNQNEARKNKYGNALHMIEKSINDFKDDTWAYNYYIESQYIGIEIFNYSLKLGKLNRLLVSKADTADINAEIKSIKNRAADFYKDYNPQTDKKVAVALIKMFIDDVKPQYYPEYIKTQVMGKYKGNVEKYVDDLFKKSLFADQTRFNNFVEKPNLKTLQKDMAFNAAISILQFLRDYNDKTEMAYYERIEGMRLFQAGLLEMYPDKQFAPDANSTMRLTYGKVGDYKPADAVHYNYFTTIDGVIEKADPDVREFNAPKKLIELYNKKDFGPYAAENGTLNVCFTSNNDITGGNSGSPVMNADGHLIGIAFDGNWEAMSGDIAFENEIQKTISVDIRYVLFIIDKFAGAQNLIDEMKIIKTEPKVQSPAVEVETEN